MKPQSEFYGDGLKHSHHNLYLMVTTWSFNVSHKERPAVHQLYIMFIAHPYLLCSKRILDSVSQYFGH